jgi:hypothetical protein
MTSSNLSMKSNKSSMSSVKSSFFMPQKGPKQSFQATDDVDESFTAQNHCCNQVNQYSIVPKTIFNEILKGVTDVSLD